MHLKRVSLSVLGLASWLLAAGCDTPPVEEAPPAAPEEALHSERGGISTSSQALLSSSPRTIDPRRSLAVTDENILAQFSFQSVMQQLATQGAVAGVDRMTLFRQLWDTQNPAPGLNLGPHCDDVRDGSLRPESIQSTRPESRRCAVAKAPRGSGGAGAEATPRTGPELFPPNVDRT